MASRRNTLAAVAAVAGLVVLAGGLIRLFDTRFAPGDVHPRYSTLSAAPEGARALYDALSRLGRPGVSRNLLPLDRFQGREETTLVLPGGGSPAFGPDTPENFERVESMMAEGLRVVVTLDAATIPASRVSSTPVADPWKTDGLPGGGVGLDPAGRGDEEVKVTAGARWGFLFEAAINPERAPREGYAVAALDGGPSAAPRWFSVWRWAGLGPEWKALAEVEGRPVIIERRFGRGSLILLSDSVFLSNEALSRAPAPEFLLWLLAQDTTLVFDETLHGTVSSPGVMHLVRHYRLVGFLGGAAVLLALYAWRAGTSLVPVDPSVAEPAGQPLVGAAGASGFSNLLRQTVPPRQLVRAGFAEWAKSAFVRRHVSPQTVTVLRDLVVASEQDPKATPVATWRAMAQALAEARREGRASRPGDGGERRWDS